ncbi:hypothetical protein [Streptomyces sp. NPDC058092]|uniref:hypothetical protein n=1 Tax=Streptomyces sp. NPDC058092 TaxID=3346336 RepID=UPI0036EBF688
MTLPTPSLRGKRWVVAAAPGIRPAESVVLAETGSGACEGQHETGGRAADGRPPS